MHLNIKLVYVFRFSLFLGIMVASDVRRWNSATFFKSSAPYVGGYQFVLLFQFFLQIGDFFFQQFG